MGGGGGSERVEVTASGQAGQEDDKMADESSKLLLRGFSA